MAVDVLLENDVFVTQLQVAIRAWAGGLSDVPMLLRRILEEKRWCKRTTKMGTSPGFERFEDFVTAKPLDGLGADMGLLRRMCADDPVVLDLLDNVTQQPDGNKTGINQHTKSGGTVDNINGSSSRPTGTNSAQAIRRLRNDRPDLHARVLAKELSPHAAMIEAGFRQKTATIPLEPKDAARRLSYHFNGNLLRQLAGELAGRLDRGSLRELIRELQSLADDEAAS